MDLGCGAQSGRRTGAGAESKCLPHLRQDAGGVRHSCRQGCGGHCLHARAQHRRVVVCVSRRHARPQWTSIGRLGARGSARAGHRRGQRRGRLCGGLKRSDAAGSNRGFRILSYGGSGDRLARGPRIAAPGATTRIYFAVMDRRVKERLIGASILVALVVLVVPELLSGPKPNIAPVPTLPAAAPEPVRNVTVDLTTSKAPETADNEPATPQTASSAAPSAAASPANSP